MQITEGCVVMISGALGTGKSDLTIKLLEHLFSEKGKEIVYITTELTPIEIESALLASGIRRTTLSRVRYLDGTQWSIEDYKRVSYITGAVSHMNSKKFTRHPSWYSK